MTARTSLTYRVTWAIAMTVALSVGLTALLAYSVMYEQEDELADQLLDIEMHRLIERLGNAELPLSSMPIELGRAVRAWVGDGADQAVEPAGLRGLPVGPHEIETDTLVLHALVANTAQGRILLVFDATGNEHRVAQFGLILFLLWAACTAVGVWVARLIAGIVVGPIRTVTERIANWDPETSHVIDTLQTAVDEPGRLLEAFNRMQDRVDQSMARQREFAANLSHEVRTPLAALRTDIEMTSLDGVVDRTQADRLARMLVAVDEIGATITAARAISQAQSSPQRQPLHLAALVEEVCSGLQSRAERAGLRLRNVISEGHVVLVDRYALLIVLRNLIGNAIEHAAPATVTLSLVEGALAVADDGPGIAAAALPFVFDRYHRGRYVDDAAHTTTAEVEPRGLGLAIARRICQQQGWLIGVQSETKGPLRGTCFLLRFDENST